MFTSFSKGKQNKTLALTCKHADDREENFLYTLNRTPPLGTGLVAHRIVPGCMQDGDADASVFVDCKHGFD